MSVTSLGKYAASVAALAVVAGIGLYARKAAPETPLTIEPMVVSHRFSREETKGGSPRAEPFVSKDALETPQRFAVHVEGKVARPGVYWLPAGGRIFEAIKLAGGALRTGDPARLNLALPVADGMKIIVPSKGERQSEPSRTGERLIEHPPVVPLQGRITPRHSPEEKPPTPDDPIPSGPAILPIETPTSESSAPIIREPSTSGALGRTTLISINRAGISELETLPGVGPATAEKIVAERRRRGGFTKIEDLLEVKGIGSVKYAKMRPFLQL